MPELGARNYKILVAQAHEEPAGGETPATAEVPASGGGHEAGAAHEGATHAGTEHAHNPLAEHPSFYYSGVALLVVAIIVTIAALGTRSIKKRNPSTAQSLAEQCVESITVFTVKAIGPGSERYVPLVATVFSFVLVSNLMGVLPTVFQKAGEGVIHLLPAPTSNLSMTIAIALVVFVMVQVAGVRENGMKGHMKHFAGPIPALSPLMFPLEIIGAFAKPLSLSIRLFGNVFGEETVIAVLVGLAATTLPWFLPIPFQFPMLMFGVFGSLVQAGVFTILTCAYISLSLGDHADHGHGEEHDDIKDEFGAHVPAH